jgi:hypothetical protein
LNRNGENHFLKMCWRRNGFKLHAILDAAPPSLVFPRIEVYAAANFPEINVEAISYFAASMFWRASVHDWNNRADEPIQLGPYEEQFRKYLMEESDFPVDCALWTVKSQMNTLSKQRFRKVSFRRSYCVSER